MLVARVRRTIRERDLIAKGSLVLVACSGGPDSVALVHALARLSDEPELALSLAVASIDHGLRQNARADVEIAREHARDLSLPFHALRVEVEPGASLQAAARRARYAALHELARRESAARIAVGHTLDDQAETVLARMLRGAGVEGLSGIAPRRSDAIVRPLIDARRSDARAFAAALPRPFASDPSNDDTRFLRTRVRATLLPALEREDPAIAVHLARLADDARAVARSLRAAGRRLLARASTGDAVRAEVLERAREAERRAALRLWARAKIGSRLSRAHLVAIDHALRGRGEVLVGDGWVVRVTGGELVATNQSGATRSSRAE